VTLGGVALSCPAGSHGYNAVAHSCDPEDDNGHGTHVAGSIGAIGNNTAGVVGVNWATSIMALRFMDNSGTGYISDVVNAIEFAVQVKQIFASTGDADVRVLNNSWSGGGFSQALSDEIARADAAGMLFVASAGNGTLDHEATPTYPADYAGANVLTVAATDYRDQLASFSDYGATHVHLGAPGVLIYSTALSSGDPGGTYELRSGTSMSAAYTSGVAALVLSHCSYSPGALRDALIRTGVPIPALAGKTSSGRRLTASAAVRSCDGTSAASPDVVVHAKDIATTDVHGAWVRQADATAADGVRLGTPDAGWSSTSAPVAQPADYVDVRVPVEAGRPYRVWLRLKASGDSKWNDSVWLQFSDARVNGARAYAINSSAGLAVNLENCSNCGVSGWGWQDGAYWLARTTVTFGSSGTQTIRIQTREDGVAFDQVVVSAGAWASTAPGQVSGDSTIVTSSGSTTTSTGAGTTPTPSAPYNGVAAAIPGTIQVENFDNGGDGVAYHDTDAVNSGGQYRQTGVDIEATEGGGQNIGWAAAGEWLAYTVNVASAGSYAADFRVASLGQGGTMHLELDGASISGPVRVPDTGWWQTWQVVSTRVTLPAGTHALRLVMDSSGANAVGNIDWITFAADAPAAPVPLRIMAVDFDNGANGDTYRDDSAGNAGGAYRATDVDIEPCAEGGFNVGWIGAGEWLRYTVDVASPGNYLLQFRVASPSGGGSLHVNAGGTNVSGAVSVPVTGSWQSWTTVSAPVTLAAGRQALTVSFDAGGFNLRFIDMTAR